MNRAELMSALCDTWPERMTDACHSSANCAALFAVVTCQHHADIPSSVVDGATRHDHSVSLRDIVHISVNKLDFSHICQCCGLCYLYNIKRIFILD